MTLIQNPKTSGINQSDLEVRGVLAGGAAQAKAGRLAMVTVLLRRAGWQGHSVPRPGWRHHQGLTGGGKRMGCVLSTVEAAAGLWQEVLLEA